MADLHSGDKERTMRKIIILEEKDFPGEPGDLTSLSGDLAGLAGAGREWDKQVDDIFLLQPYHTIQCLKSGSHYSGGSSVADFVKYILSE